MGQKTSQLQATALNRINVRRLVNYIKYIVYRISFPYIGRLNTVQQRANLTQEINDFMDRVKFNNGVYAYRLILDDSNNTPDVIDNNGLVAELKIQPTKVIEYIDPITITVTRTGVTL
jgi:phage tail sheath protein FI